MSVMGTALLSNDRSRRLGGGKAPLSLRHGPQFEDVGIVVAQIDPTSTVPVVELTIVDAPRGAPIGQLRLANAPEDGVELGIADVERVMVTLEFLGVVEQERERVVDTYRRKMAAFPIDLE